MDVLQYWKPSIEQQNFRRSDFSDEFQRNFFEFVQLVHCVEHWKGEQQSMRTDRLFRGDELKDGIRKVKGHEMRARFLAAERAFKMVTVDCSESEQKFGIYVIKTIGLTPSMRSHETADFSKFFVTAWPDLIA